MKKTMVKSLALAVVGGLLMAGSAMALPSEWGVINPTNIVGPTSLVAQSGPAYSIWTDDIERTMWHIEWTGHGTGTAGFDLFSGIISLQNNSFGTVTPIAFETGGTYGDTINILGGGTGFTAWANSGKDGIDFQITSTGTPSYVGFDLAVNNQDADSNFIYLGNLGETVASLGEDQDFAIAAPVPEPTTMLLFGTGLIGLAGISRRRKARKS